MHWFLQLPVLRLLHAKGVLWVAGLVIAVVGVLIAGALEPVQTPTRAPSTQRTERSTPTRLSIRPDLEKTPLAYQADYWEQLGERALPHLVLIGPSRVPGIVVDPGFVLTASSAVEPVAAPVEAAADVPVDANQDSNASPDGLAEGTSPAVDVEEAQPEQAGGVDGDDPALGAGLVAVDWDGGVALYELGDPATAPAFTAAASTSFSPGAFAIAVTRTLDREVQLTPGHVTAVRRTNEADIPESMDVSLELAMETKAAAVIDLDGNLLGAAIRTDRGVRVLAGGELAATVTGLKRGLPCYAIETSDISDELLALLDVDTGVVVERIRETAFLAGGSVLEPGDVLVEWNREPVSSVDQFQELYRGHVPGEQVPHVVLRGSRRVRGTSVVPDRHCRPLPPDDALELTSIGVTLRWSATPDGPVDTPSPSSGSESSSAWMALQVSPGGRADAGGLMAGDRIMSVNGRPLAESKQTARRTLERLVSGARAIVVTVWRDGRVKLLAVMPPDA